jgi:hypothetical protein
MVTRRQAGISKPNPKYAMHVAYNSQPLEPTCYSQVVKHEEWHQAMGMNLMHCKRMELGHWFHLVRILIYYRKNRCSKSNENLMGLLIAINHV